MLYIHIMYLFNMLLHYIICYYYYEIGNKLSYPKLSYPNTKHSIPTIDQQYVEVHLHCRTLVQSISLSGGGLKKLFLS